MIAVVNHPISPGMWSFIIFLAIIGICWLINAFTGY